ncbi:MAG: hypothetical protein Q7J85_12675 [Bacillota bacterium]|nr:hypothetical protein [Bacillota bacterium]
MEVTFTLRDEKVNIYALTQGYGDYHQIFLCKKSVLPDDRIGPFVLDIKSSNPQYELSNKGECLLAFISSKQYSFNYAAYIDCYIEFKVSDNVFKELCTKGYFDIWEPGAPMKYFEGRSTGYLMVLRVYKLRQSVPEILQERGRKGRNFYYRLTQPHWALGLLSSIALSS